LRNKGKYPMSFKFIAQTPKLFTIVPSEGIIAPNDKQQTVVITFKSNHEVFLKNSTEIWCHMSDPHSNALIAKIPMNVSVNSVFSKYTISPERGINFGPFAYGAKKSRTFIVKNEGEFDFRYYFLKITEDYRIILSKFADEGAPKPTSKQENKKGGN